MSGNAGDTEVNKLDLTPVLMWFTLCRGRQKTLNKECKCDEVYKREMFGVLRTCSEGINSRGTLLRPGRAVMEPN